MDSIFIFFFYVLYEEAVTGGVHKKGVLKNFTKFSQEDTCAGMSYL